MHMCMCMCIVHADVCVHVGGWMCRHATVETRRHVSMCMYVYYQGERTEGNAKI